MTGYLYAARACRTQALLAALATVLLIHAGHPGWAALTGWAAFLGFLMGRFLNLGHNSTVTDRTTRTRPAHADKETTTR